MTLESRKVIVNKSTKDLFDILKNPKGYENLMLEEIVHFEHIENGFKFRVNGVPEITLKISEIIENQKIVLISENPSPNFSLTGLLNPISDHQSEVQLVFNGKFNPFVKMMVEKPLQKFISRLTDKIEGL